MNKHISIAATFIFSMVSILTALAQPSESKVVDKVAAVVGNNIILKSEMDMQYAQYIMQGNQENPSIKCQILQQMLMQKLLAQQAAIDSIDVTEDELDDNINMRIRQSIQRAGGQDRLEQFLNRSILQYKEEMRHDVKEQMIAQRMQQQITGKIDVTPLEVKRFFEKIPADSVPSYNTEVEVGQIDIDPILTKKEKDIFKNRAEILRLEIKNGDDFGTKARLYSEDEGSAPNGGDLGFFDRSSMVKEFSAVAFRLKPGELSDVFETEYGFHFLQVTERRGEQVRARHILIKFKPSEAALERAKRKADSIYNLVISKKMDFYTAATHFSDDKETKYNGGMLIAHTENGATSYIPTDHLDAGVFAAIDTLKPGEYSRPAKFTAQGQGQEGKTGYRFTYLKSRSAPHKATLEQDFAKIKEVAIQEKTNRILSKWFDARRSTTYVKIDDEYKTCDELKMWTKPLDDSQGIILGSN
ncbi:periplasmic chaperone for outer membrane proteins SurA [bacterium A37T11]|nr:periplasmic chaperone for outer membrane proteins SurA [bacterium A37T11]